MPKPHRTVEQAIPDSGEEKKSEAAIAEVERLRDRLIGRSASTDAPWSVTGWRSVDWLLVALIVAFVLYVLFPRV